VTFKLKPAPTCACGAPRRSGGNACSECHARHNRDYRARQKKLLAAKLARLAELERRHA
jgi:hypothetical protein